MTTKWQTIKWYRGAWWIFIDRAPHRRATDDEIDAAHADGR